MSFCRCMPYCGRNSFVSEQKADQEKCCALTLASMRQLGDSLYGAHTQISMTAALSTASAMLSTVLPCICSTSSQVQ